MEATGNGVCGQAVSADDIKEIQIGGGSQNAGRLKTSGEFENLIGSPSLGHWEPLLETDYPKPWTF